MGGELRSQRRLRRSGHGDNRRDDRAPDRYLPRAHRERVRTLRFGSVDRRYPRQ